MAIGSECVFASYRVLGSRFRGNDGRFRGNYGESDDTP